MISLKSLAEMYDILYWQADDILKVYNLCQFGDGKCRRDRFGENGDKDGCCGPPREL